jgi:hypothetical protein
MSTPSDAPPTLTELKLTPQMKQEIDGAASAGRPISVAYVSDGEPMLSYRGSTQAFSDDQLAIWVRNRDSGLGEAARRNAVVALIFGKFDPDDRGFMVFRGRARLDDSEAVRRRVYEGSSAIEQSFDQEREGVPLIIDLDSVDGFFGGARLHMRR